MNDTLTRYLAGIASERDRAALRAVLAPVMDRMSCQSHSSAGLEITAGGGTTAQIGSTSTWHGVVQGVSRTIAAGTDMPALSGTITADSFNVFCFYIDRDGTRTAEMGTEGTTRALLKFPVPPEGKTMIGYIVVTHSATFTGGTTALDTATTLYVNVLGAFDPSVLI